MDYVRWSHSGGAAHQSRILPDGCRDVIVLADTGQIMLTALDLTPRPVWIAAGQRMEGYRLRPGAWVDPRDLERPLAATEIAGLIRYDAEVGEAIEALGGATTVAEVARQAGLSERSLQRRFADADLPPPAFWRMLGRARRAVALPVEDTPLADMAIDAGYADQAHMTRDFGRWFGLTPRQLKADARTRAALAQPGLGNWTGEQISIR
jgi:AraC-like DNA-binding protein